MNGLETKVNGLEEDMKQLKTVVMSLETRVQQLEDGMKQVNNSVRSVENNIIEFERQQKYIQLILENDIKKNISLVAEGHMNLDRKLNQFREDLTDRHLLDLRVAVLEGDVSVLKEKMEVLTA